MTTSLEIAAGVEPGDLLAGKYKIDRVIGVGGIGVVVAAHHVQLDEKVALKFLLPTALASRDAVARFEREARAAAKIKNEHVARVSDVGVLDNGSPYMVMEYLEGTDLAGMLEKGGPLPVEQAVDFVLQASEALAEAHSHGIVHRDLKPANLFCVERADGQLWIKVLDFGISKITAPDGHALTRTSTLMGSPSYMSPEQMQSARVVDARSDIWALGVILYELVSGATPFAAELITELALKVTLEAAPSVRVLRPDAPQGLERVIAKCLEKDRANRYQTVAELALALEEIAPAHARLSVERIVRMTRRAAGGSVPSFTESMILPPRSSVADTGALANTEIVVDSTATANATSAAVVTSRAGPVEGDGSASRRSLGRGAAIAIALGVLALFGVVILLGTRDKRAPAQIGLVQSAPPAAPTIAPAEPPTAAKELPPPNPPLATSALPPSSSAPIAPPVRPPPVASEPSVVTHAGATKRPVPSAAPLTPPPSHPAAPSCDPPYFYDEKGTQHFKKECL